jgi:hypothetical protein
MEKFFQVNAAQKQAGVARLTFDKAEFKPKLSQKKQKKLTSY